ALPKTLRRDLPGTSKSSRVLSLLLNLIIFGFLFYTLSQLGTSNWSGPPLGKVLGPALAMVLGGITLLAGGIAGAKFRERRLGDELDDLSFEVSYVPSAIVMIYAPHLPKKRVAKLQASIN